MTELRPILLVLVCCALPAGADEAARHGAVLETCYRAAGDGEARAACEGRMAEVCMAAEAQGETTLGMSRCLIAETAVWDRFLNVEYRATRDHLTAMDAAGSPDFAHRAEALRKAQRAWIAFRDAECGLEYARWGAGSLRVIAGARCHLSMTAERTLELRGMREEDR